MSYGSYPLTSKTGKMAKKGKAGKGNGYIEVEVSMSYGSYDTLTAKATKRS
jgi:hypothetical protein